MLHPTLWMSVKRSTGLCLLFKRELLHTIGLLDEQFGLGTMKRMIIVTVLVYMFMNSKDVEIHLFITVGVLA